MPKTEPANMATRLIIRRIKTATQPPETIVISNVLDAEMIALMAAFTAFTETLTAEDVVLAVSRAAFSAFRAACAVFCAVLGLINRMCGKVRCVGTLRQKEKRKIIGQLGERHSSKGARKRIIEHGPALDRRPKTAFAGRSGGEGNSEDGRGPRIAPA
jgi:hypothetical protein